MGEAADLRTSARRSRGGLRGDLAFLLTFFIVWAVCARVLCFSPLNVVLERALGGTGTGLLLRAITVAVWIGFAAAYLRATRRERPLAYLELRGNVPRGLAAGGLIGLALVAKDLARVELLEGRVPELGGLTPASFLSPFVEEVVFRGLILRRAREYTGLWRANALTSVLFVSIHLPGWIFAGADSPSGLLASSAFIFLLSVLIGYLLERTGSLWACVVCHAMSNWGTTF